MIMKLKKSPPGMSYEEVRGRKNKQEAESSDTLHVVPHEALEVPEAPISDPVPASPEAKPERETDKVNNQETEKGMSLSTTQQDPRQSTPPARRRQTAAPRAGGNKQSESVLVKAYVAQPARGVSPTYDEIAPVYGDKAALKHLLDVAMISLQEAIEANEVDSLEAEPNYAAVAKRNHVSRAFAYSSYAILEKKIDPIGILKFGTVGRTIVQGALNRFIAREQAAKE